MELIVPRCTRCTKDCFDSGFFFHASMLETIVILGISKLGLVLFTEFIPCYEMIEVYQLGQYNNPGPLILAWLAP